jgi:hypothetical protein
VPQLCSTGGTWQNQAACARGCQNGACIPQQGLGSSCGAATDCTSGFCVDGVCCESACQGVCTQCQAGTGRCIAPADDGACPTLSCATGDPCRVGNPINTNRCLSIGQCKTAANCTVSTPARTACAAGEDIGCGNASPCLVTRLCNGAGACVAPTIACDSVPNLPVTADACCDVPMPIGEEIDEETYTTQCEIGAFGHLSAFCDSQNDCPTGSVCCMVDLGNFNSMACSTSCPESGKPNDPGGAGTYLLCRSPGGGTSQCPGGRACERTHAGLNGYTFCNL